MIILDFMIDHTIFTMADTIMAVNGVMDIITIEVKDTMGGVTIIDMMDIGLA